MTHSPEFLIFATLGGVFVGWLIAMIAAHIIRRRHFGRMVEEKKKEWGISNANARQ